MIVTDPPHGDRIPYLELSEIWNVILGEEPPFEAEIVVSNAKERSKKSLGYYQAMTKFLEIASRKLRASGCLVLFFNARTDLWAKVSDHPSAECKQLIVELVNFRNTLVTEIEADSGGLIRWLYENQGDRRFDASNRLFLVLVDQRNYFDSWKLKRAKPLMEAKIRVPRYFPGLHRAGSFNLPATK